MVDAEIVTPALVVEDAVLDANIATMAAFARQAGIRLRPHAKTHKSSLIAKRQLAAGAIGISCATILEAEALQAGGLSGLLLTSPVADPARAARLVALHRRSPLAAVIDHSTQIDWLAAAVAPGDPPLDILVDIDLGQMRTGIVDIADAVHLARAIEGAAGLAFRGLQGFGGHIQHVVDAGEREAAVQGAARRLDAIKAALWEDGFGCAIVSGSGTGTYDDDTAGPYTELQVGSYLFMDADYRRLQGRVWPFRSSLFVLATVVSVNRVGQVTVDAGVKALAFNGPSPDMLIGAPAGSRYQFAGDEHGIIHLPAGAPPPSPGARILIAATHCDPTVNNYSGYLFVSPGGEITHVPIEGRY